MSWGRELKANTAPVDSGLFHTASVQGALAVLLLPIPYPDNFRKPVSLHPTSVVSPAMKPTKPEVHY